MKGYICNKETMKVVMIIDEVIKIDIKNNLLHLKDNNRGTGTIEGLDFTVNSIIVPKTSIMIEIGEVMSDDIIDISDQFKVINMNEILVNSLGEELTKLKLEMMILKGGI